MDLQQEMIARPTRSLSEHPAWGSAAPPPAWPPLAAIALAPIADDGSLPATMLPRHDGASAKHSDEQLHSRLGGVLTALWALALSGGRDGT